MNGEKKKKVIPNTWKGRTHSDFYAWQIKNGLQLNCNLLTCKIFLVNAQCVESKCIYRRLLLQLRFWADVSFVLRPPSLRFIRNHSSYNYNFCVLKKRQIAYWLKHIEIFRERNVTSQICENPAYVSMHNFDKNALNGKVLCIKHKSYT